MAFLIKNEIMAVPAVIIYAENSGIKVSSAGLMIVSVTNDADMVIFNDREITVPFIQIAGLRIQVEHKKTAAAKGLIGTYENRLQFAGRHDVIETVEDRDNGMIF